uniref:Uncharacterized protein n=1 Tax=viral metagenome TaxID=1070528 RepID=A0A6C0IWL7_9ZZZZ
MTLEKDFLENDPPIRGQNYVCLSFVSPDKILENKNLFLVKKYLEDLVSEKNINLDKEYLDNIADKYEDFLYNNRERYSREFDEKNDFNTSVRGVKVRGVYDTIQEAETRAKQFQSMDKYFNVFVGQVGYWLPWDPNPDSIENQEYGEKDLNELVKKYQENKDAKDKHFRENVDHVKNEAQKKIETSNENENENENSIEKTLNEKDPWLKQKENQSE